MSLSVLLAIAEHALADARGLPALMDRLERDPSPVIRRDVASRMLVLWARDPLVRASSAKITASTAARLRDLGRGGVTRNGHRVIMPVL
jgi:hypothetical protein